MPIAAARMPNGRLTAFAESEVVYRPANPAELQAFIAKYHGTILVDGSRERGTAAGKLQPPRGSYLILVDPARSSLDDFGASMDRARITGKVAFSSERAARLTSLVAREAATSVIGLNPELHWDGFITETQILEGTRPDTGTQLNYADTPWATGTLNLANEQLGIGVVRAWDYLEYKGIPFGNTWHRPPLAILDGGFALDAATGAPIDGNLDFEEGQTPLQLNEDTVPSANRHNAGGRNRGGCSIAPNSCPWHGTGVFSVAAAVPRNEFGSAGTGAEIVKPYFINVNSRLGYEFAQGIIDAVLIEPPADVINISAGSGNGCGDFCGFFYNANFGDMQDAVNFARGYNNTIVVASAGNNNDGDDNRLDNVPCTLDNVLCVGAINIIGRAEPFSGSGSRVAIWAPDMIFTTPDPDSGGALRVFGGTSASAPFVSGIVALMKALNPNLDPDGVRQIVQSTALASPDPKVTPGYINALGAVMATSPNQAPSVSILQPATGTNAFFGQALTLQASVSDPEQDPKVDGVSVQWTSNIDGFLCSGIMCDSKPLSPGSHLITATVSDPWGASAIATANIVAVSPGVPTAYIAWPSSNATIFSSQQVDLRGSAWSPAEGAIPDNDLSWTSSASGPLGIGNNVHAALPLGSQTLTLNAKDQYGQVGSTSIPVTVQSGSDYPSVHILQPASDFAWAGQGGVMTLVGVGTDPVDGSLPDAGLEWKSDIDGILGHGTSLSVTLTFTTCAPTYHHITLTGTNQAGHQGSMTLTVLSGNIC